MCDVGGGGGGVWVCACVDGCVCGFVMQHIQHCSSKKKKKELSGLDTRLWFKPGQDVFLTPLEGDTLMF